MSNFQESKRFAEKASGGREATAELVKGAEEATTLMREFNVKLIDMAKTNTQVVLDFARRLATAQPSDLPQIWTELSQKQFELITDQSRELTSLAQRIAGVSMQPFNRR